MTLDEIIQMLQSHLATQTAEYALAYGRGDIANTILIYERITQTRGSLAQLTATRDAMNSTPAIASPAIAPQPMQPPANQMSDILPAIGL